MTYKIYLLSTIIFFIFIVGCTNHGIEPANENNKSITVNLRRGSLGSYSSISQQEILSTRVFIFVDKLNEDYTLETNFGDYNFNKNNSVNDPWNFHFPDIVIPENGSFSITVEVQGTECYIGCSSSSICSNYNEGFPILRKVTLFPNSEDIPNIIYIDSVGFAGCL